MHDHRLNVGEFVLISTTPAYLPGRQVQPAETGLCLPGAFHTNGGQDIRSQDMVAIVIELHIAHICCPAMLRRPNQPRSSFLDRSRYQTGGPSATVPPTQGPIQYQHYK